ncbi:glycosyltransferase family 25 protein [Yersinia pseudotuberculosis]|uniref:glycosyltransferase family 25 protein n=1 Tax=Yersinia pseudotuberculosis TaxID=633 RepID=UPI0005E12EA6|nr:glycosyltransferase family 25 protein [Yersinia pseudotuberculosis]CND08892.1 LPS glycosyltransferase family protein [Yersinia pseudotuberculosis]
MNGNWNWSLVDKVVYINLKERTDRNEHIKKELEKVCFPPEKIIRFEAIRAGSGFIGCAKSHLAVLKMAQENNWKNILVLEDDMVFENDDETIIRTNNFLSKLNNIHWDAAFLSASYYIVNAIDDNFFKVNFAYLANSYLVNNHYYEKLINNYTESVQRLTNGESSSEYGLDSNWLKIMKIDNWYGIYPVIGYQRTDISDIEYKEIDRTHQFTRTFDKMKAYGSK